MFRSLILLAALLFFSLPAHADQMSDGKAAYDRKDYQTALKLWRPLADNGNARAQIQLAMMYELGKGVKQDDAEARTWLRKAASRGNPDAELILGGICWNAKDYAEAGKWLRKAADNRKPDAYAPLGRMYGLGLGVRKNIPEAYFWMSLAAKAGKEPYPVRETLTRWYLRILLTSEQKAAVDKRMAEWLKQPPASASKP